MSEIYDEGVVNKVPYSVVYNKQVNQYVFTAGDTEAYFDDTYQVNTFLDKLDSFTWSCCR